MFLTPKKSNARNQCVIDVYALFAISYTHLPPMCAKIPYNNHMLRSAFLATPLERTMPLHCQKPRHDFVRVLAGELHANSVRRCRHRIWRDPLRALGGKFPGILFLRLIHFRACDSDYGSLDCDFATVSHRPREPDRREFPH